MNTLVYVKFNINLDLHHLKGQDKGDKDDQIRPLNMEFNDKWISKKELMPIQRYLTKRHPYMFSKRMYYKRKARYNLDYI